MKRAGKILLCLVLVAVLFGMPPTATVRGQTGAWAGTWITIGSIYTGGFLYTPKGIAVDSSGNVYVADPYNVYGIKKLNSDGSWTKMSGTTFSASQGDLPWGVAAHGSDLYVVNCVTAPDGTRAVWKYTSSTTAWTDITDGHPFHQPQGIAVDSSGIVYVTDTGGGTVVKLPAAAVIDGADSWAVIGHTGWDGGAYFEQPIGIAVDSSNNLFVTDYTNAGGGPGEQYQGEVYELPNGSTSWLGSFGVTAGERATGIAVYGGNIYANFGTYMWVKPVDSVVPAVGRIRGSPSAFQLLYGMAIDSSGNVYVTDKDSSGYGVIYKHQGWATQLVWGTQPGGGATGQNLSPQPTVKLEDAFGNVITTAGGDAVTVSLTTPGGATLGGTRTVTLVNGVATFTNLSVDTAGTYTLTASGTISNTELRDSWGLLIPGILMSTGQSNSFTITAQYIVTFDSQGGSSVPSQTIPANGLVTEPTDPTRAGYTFAGWYKEPACTTSWNFLTDTVTSTLTLYARWTAVSYTITYQLDGGTNDPDNPSSYSVESAAITLKNPSKAGYTFAGWSGTDVTDVQMNVTIPAGSTGNRIYTAHWTEIPVTSYTVTFDSQGGSSVPSQTIPASGLVIQPTDPTRAGYTFAGWYKEPACTTSWNFLTDTVTSTLTLYARWTAVSYTITYQLDGGTNDPDNPSSYSVESAAITLKNPSKAGYTFAGWSGTDVTDVQMNVTIPAGSTGNRIYTAHWTEIPVTSYTVTFDSQGGSSVPSQTIPASGLVIQPTDPTRAGYTFAGWYKEPACTTSWNFLTDTVTSTLTFYARWTAPATYTVIAMPNTADYGSVSGGGRYAGGTLVVLRAAPNLGCVFVRWLDGSITVATAPEYAFTITGDRTLTAEFARIEVPAWHAVTVSNAGSGTVSASPGVAMNGAIITLSSTPPTGYHFLAWRAVRPAGLTIVGNTFIMPDEAVIIEALFEANRYIVTFDSPGGSGIAPQTIPYNGFVTKTADPARAGYTFAGWYMDKECTTAWEFVVDRVTADMTLYARWTASPRPNVSIISATPNSTSYGSVSGGGSFTGFTWITLRATPKAGCRFVRWREATTTVATTPDYAFTTTGDRTLTAEFARIGVPAGVKAVSLGYSSVKVTWGAVTGAGEYEVYRASSKNGAYTKAGTASGTSWVQTGLTAGKAWYYKVQVKCVAGGVATYGGYSAIVTARPVPATPAGVKATRASSTSITLSWGGVAGTTRYEISRATSAGGPYTTVAVTTGPRYTDTRLTTGKTYYYKVRAYRLVGTTKVYGSYSVVIAAKT